MRIGGEVEGSHSRNFISVGRLLVVFNKKFNSTQKIIFKFNILQLMQFTSFQKILQCEKD